MRNGFRIVHKRPKEGREVRSFFGLLVVVAIVAGGWFLLSHYEIQGLDHLSLKPRPPLAGAAADSRETPLPSRESPEQRQSIRIASFNIQVFGVSKLKDPAVMRVLAEVVRRFDMVAVQEVRSKSQDVMPKFVALINAQGAKYDYVISPRLGRTTSQEQYAFIYDTSTIELDVESQYVVDDPDDLLHREPFVAGFRARGPPPDEAFTFTLVNIHTDPDETDQELNALDDVFRAVQRDGRGEDDVILLGDLNVDDRHLGELGGLSHITWAITGQTSNTRGTKLYDNLVFHQVATSEYAGRSGVLNLMQEFNLTLDQALEVSDHLPIWGEFSVYEGGRPGRVASRLQSGVK